MREWVKELLEKKKKMDPVDKDELKGTHSDRKDGDIDNDGDEDGSDKYLHNRRKTIKKSMSKDEGYVSNAQRKAVWASRKDGGKGHPDAKKESVEEMKKNLTPKQIKRALASIKPPKKKPTLPQAPWDKKKSEAYNEPQGQAKRMMSPLHKARMDKEKADRDRDGKLKPGITMKKESTKVDEAGPRHTMTPMHKRFGGTVIPKKFDAYKKFVKKNNIDEPTVRMIRDNPDAAESKRMMKNKNVAQAVDLYKAAHMKREAYEGIPSATHKGYQDPMGKGMAPNAKAQLAKKMPVPEPVDEPKVNAKNFKDFRKGLKVAPKRKGDNPKGDRAPVK